MRSAPLQETVRAKLQESLILRKTAPPATTIFPSPTTATMSGASENKYILTSMGFLKVGADFRFYRWRRGAPNSTNSGQQQRQSSSSLRGGEAAGQKNAWGQNKARGTGSGPQSPRTGPTPGGTAAIPQPAPQLKDAVSTTDPIATEIKAYFNGSKCKLIQMN